MSVAQDPNSNFYNLIVQLVSPYGGSLRTQGLSAAGRTTLCKEFDVPCTDPSSVGYLFVNYDTGNNFNLFIDAMINASARTLSGKDPGAKITDREQLPSWNDTYLFAFLHLLTKDAALGEHFQETVPGGSADAQQAFLKENVVLDGYGEFAAITGLMDHANVAQFGKSMNNIITTFNAQYQLCC